VKDSPLLAMASNRLISFDVLTTMASPFLVALKGT